MPRYVYRDVYEWDIKKDQTNIRKHSLSFKEAAPAFEDPQFVLRFDKKHSSLEERWYCIGKIGDYEKENTPQ